MGSARGMLQLDRLMTCCGDSRVRQLVVLC
jgi:hypothetical protein